jgi:hypothetical protein
VVELLLEFILDYFPAFFYMGYNALGTVLEAGGQNAEVAGTAKQEERAVAEEAGLPVLQLVAWQKLALVIDKVFIVHSSSRSSSIYSPLLALSSLPFAFSPLPMLSALSPSSHVHVPSDASCNIRNPLRRSNSI